MSKLVPHTLEAWIVLLARWMNVDEKGGGVIGKVCVGPT